MRSKAPLVLMEQLVMVLVFALGGGAVRAGVRAVGPDLPGAMRPGTGR